MQSAGRSKHSLVWLSAVALLVVAACQAEAPPEQEGCPEALLQCDGACVDPAANPLHCGGCSRPCPSGNCEEGECVVEARQCPPGQRDCGGACVDLANSLQHCGSCERSCGEGESCVEGACVSESGECEGEKLRCGNACVDTTRDDEHCGACDSPCAAGESCLSGFCWPTCEDGEICDGACVDTQVSAAHCGGCFHACDESEVCSEGSCTCPENSRRCGAFCAPYADPENCGACGHSCLELAGVIFATCEEDRCVLSCGPNAGNCDGDPDNGCEVDLSSELEHCGACEKSCLGLWKVEDVACAHGECHVLDCAEGWEDCDGDPSNGCEAPVDEDKRNCGGCGTDCTALPQSSSDSFCAEGVCELHCDDDHLDCDGVLENGCEINRRIDDENCGACGTVCGEEERCLFGICGDPELVQWRIPPTGTPGPFVLTEHTAYDQTTGLTWMRQGVGKFNYADSEAYCDGLTLEGHSDWRIPTFVELLSLVDLSRRAPAIDDQVFTVVSDEYWTQTSYVGNKNNLVYLVDFKSGNSMLTGRTTSDALLCVRGGKGSKEQRAVISEEVVEDRITGKMWQRKPSSPETMAWADALDYCENLSLAGHSDWRLPHRKELESLTDKRLFRPALDLEVFPGTLSAYYWASEEDVQNANQAWASTMESGSVYFFPKTNLYGVRCVRDLPH